MLLWSSVNIKSQNVLKFKGWFSLAHKHNKWEHPRHKRQQKQKHKKNEPSYLSCAVLKTNMFVFLVLMLVLMREWEQHKTNKWIRSSAYVYAYVAGVLTCLCLCYAYACAYAYALVRTSLNSGVSWLFQYWTWYIVIKFHFYQLIIFNMNYLDMKHL